MAVVIILAKAPLAGLVKTRLSPPLSLTAAAGLAAAALQDTIVAARQAMRPTAVVVVFDGDPSPWIPADLPTIPQCSGGLDVRLADAFDRVHADHSASMVLIAMDTPQVTPTMIDDAIVLLEADDCDAVIGPAEDGGYWLIGLRPLRVSTNESSYAPLFHGVPMSTDETGAGQRARLEAMGWRVRTTNSLRDIDHFFDVEAVASEHPHLAMSAYWRNPSAP